KRKLAFLGFALLATAGTLVLQPRPAEASNCFCADAACCDYCCTLSSGKVICTERPCPVQ
ncbi:MAG TPA: hypothetical protein VIJ02_03740, partial [Thermoanaerobaculia bacterium]